MVQLQSISFVMATAFSLSSHCMWPIDGPQVPENTEDFGRITGYRFRQIMTTKGWNYGQKSIRLALIHSFPFSLKRGYCSLKQWEQTDEWKISPNVCFRLTYPTGMLNKTSVGNFFVFWSNCLKIVKWFKSFCLPKCPLSLLDSPISLFCILDMKCIQQGSELPAKKERECRRLVSNMTRFG